MFTAYNKQQINVVATDAAQLLRAGASAITTPKWPQLQRGIDPASASGVLLTPRKCETYEGKIMTSFHHLPTAVRY